MYTQEIDDFIRPRWENDCQVVLPCGGVWENKALHKPFLFFSAEQKLAGRCWLFSWLLDLVSAAIIIRGIKMELSASRVCWLARLWAKDLLQLGESENEQKVVSGKKPHLWRLVNSNFHLHNDPPVESPCRLTQPFHHLPCLPGCTQTLLFNGVDFCFLLFVIHRWVALLGLASHHDLFAKNWSLWAATFEG